MLTDYVIASDTRFKAAISGAGSANHISLYGHDQYTYLYDNEFGPPWENIDLWIKYSYPFFKANKITTPTLFLRATEPVPGIEHEQVPGRGGWQASWKDAHTIIDVPSHHYSMMLQHASSTAQVIQDWLGALPAGEAPARVEQVVRATDPCVTP